MNLKEHSSKYYEEDEQEEEENEKISLNRRKKKYKTKKNKQKKNDIYSPFSIILFIIVIIIFISCIISFKNSFQVTKISENNLRKYNKINITESITINNNKSYNNESKEINLSYNNEMNETNNLSINIINETKQNNITAIINTTNFSENISNNDIILYNNTKKKISIAFVYSTLYANGIARFIAVTANYLIETGKYDIYIITGNPYSKDYKINNKIKKVPIYGNSTLLRNFTKYIKIDFFILQNVVGRGTVNFYKQLGKKVIGMFHGLYMSAMFHGIVSSYKNWIEFDYFDAYIIIGYDDYFFYKKLGFKNEIFIPNLYTFEPSSIKISNLTYHNIVMLGRMADKIKGGIYAIQTMRYVINEIPDAKLIMASSNSNIDFLKDLAKRLNITKNIIFNSYTENISELFWNSSVLMYTSLSEAFPMAMNEAKAHGLPVVAFDVPYSPPYHSGVILVDMLDCKSLANETIKLLKDYNYRRKMGEESKFSLNKFKNSETIKLWEKLFNSLLEGEESFRKLQKKVEMKYYNEEKARKRFEKKYNDLLRYNKNFTCHTLNNFTDINYIKNISNCPVKSTNSTNPIVNNKNLTNKRIENL